MKKTFILILATMMTSMALASTAVINFSGKTSNGTTCSLDKVLVENLTQGWEQTTTKVSLSIEITDQDAVEDVLSDEDFKIFSNLDGKTRVVFNMPKAGQVSAFVYDVTGRCVCQSISEQSAGCHALNLEFNNSQMYYLHISTPGKKFSHSILNLQSGNRDNIQYVTDVNVHRVPALDEASNTCKPGDIMHYTGYTTHKGTQYTAEEQQRIQSGTTNIVFVFSIPSDNADYYIKHPWGGGDWTWQPMTKNGSKYEYTGEWGGVGANVNTKADDAGANWFEASAISGASSVNTGDEVKFVYNPSTESLSIEKTGTGDDQPTTTTYYIKHPWGGGDWTWQLMTKNGNKYEYTGKWGDNGANINTRESDDGAVWYEKSDISGSGSISKGKTVTFTFSPSNGASGTLSVSSNGGGDPTSSKPSTPTGLTATASSSCINLSWNSVSGATSYIVYRSTSASGSYTNIKSTTSTSYQDCSVTAGTTYYYKVAAKNSAGTSSQSSYVSAKVSSGGTSTLSAPTNVHASYMISSHQVQVTWDEPALADSYEIYRSTSASSNGSKRGTATSSGGAVYIDKLSSSDDQVTYYYRVKAKSSYLNKTSDFSDYAYVYVDKNPTAPCPVSNLKVSGYSSLTFSWTIQTQSGCGNPTERWIQFYDYSKTSGDKWVSELITSDSYTLSSSKVNQYTNSGSTLAGCVKLVNAHGVACVHFEYNTNSKSITILSTNCYDD